MSICCCRFIFSLFTASQIAVNNNRTCTLIKQFSFLLLLFVQEVMMGIYCSFKKYYPLPLPPGKGFMHAKKMLSMKNPRQICLCTTSSQKNAIQGVDKRVEVLMKVQMTFCFCFSFDIYVPFAIWRKKENAEGEGLWKQFHIHTSLFLFFIRSLVLCAQNRNKQVNHHISMIFFMTAVA